jgi:hypothetical protein
LDYILQWRLFLTDIGRSQIENEIQKEVNSIINNNLNTLEEQSGLSLSMSEEEIKAYTKMVVDLVAESKLRDK